MFDDELITAIDFHMASFIEGLYLDFLRLYTHNLRRPKFNFHWLRELSSFEVIGELTLDLREV